MMRQKMKREKTIAGMCFPAACLFIFLNKSLKYQRKGEPYEKYLEVEGKDFNNGIKITNLSPTTTKEGVVIMRHILHEVTLCT